jgi:hypothetical protein
MTADGSHLQQFCMILLFCVETQPGCQNNSGKETSLSYRHYLSIWSFSQKDKTNDKNTQNTLERNSQKNSDKINFIGNLFIHMLQ